MTIDSIGWPTRKAASLLRRRGARLQVDRAASKLAVAVPDAEDDAASPKAVRDSSDGVDDPLGSGSDRSSTSRRGHRPPAGAVSSHCHSTRRPGGSSRSPQVPVQGEVSVARLAQIPALELKGAARRSPGRKGRGPRGRRSRLTARRGRPDTARRTLDTALGAQLARCGPKPVVGQQDRVAEPPCRNATALAYGVFGSKRCRSPGSGSWSRRSTTDVCRSALRAGHQAQGAHRHQLSTGP